MWFRKSCQRKRALPAATWFCLLCLGFSSGTWAQYEPARNLDPASASIRLGTQFQDDAWLVYTYDIDVQGNVTNAAIRRSNGVTEVETAVLDQVRSMRFQPATRGGTPVQSSANPVIFTWILDKQREMGPAFAERSTEAWDLFASGDYAAAGTIASELLAFPGRNALEEVKASLLAAAVSHRLGDNGAETRHLGRVMELQSLALDNNFRHGYVPTEQYLKVLSRLVTLHAEGNRLGDAGVVLDRMQALARGEPVVQQAAARYVEAENFFRNNQDVAAAGELVALYPGGAATWKLRLTRDQFYISDVSGSVSSVFLICAQGQRVMARSSKQPWRVPAGWDQCKVDVSGTVGTRLLLHQVSS
ncbi:energy transducer TonB [Pseudohalioglobus sediminis]|nr:energy transducer TonB [Pseudohalioglobus sediminis]